MENIIIGTSVLIGFVSGCSLVLWKRNHVILSEILRKEKEICRKCDYFDRPWLDVLTNLEKKVRTNYDHHIEMKKSFSLLKGEIEGISQGVKHEFPLTKENIKY